MNPEDQQWDEANTVAFQQGVTDFVKAVNEKADAEAATIAWQMLLTAGAEALSNPTPSVTWMTMAAECEDLADDLDRAASGGHSSGIALSKERLLAWPLLPGGSR